MYESKTSFWTKKSVCPTLKGLLVSVQGNSVKCSKPVARTASQLPVCQPSSLLIHTKLLCGSTFPETHKIEIPEKTLSVSCHMLFTCQCLYYFALLLLKTFLLLVLCRLLNSCFWTKSFSIKELSFHFRRTCQKPCSCLASFPLLPVLRVPVCKVGRGAVRRERWGRAAGCSARRSDKQPRNRSRHWPRHRAHRSAWRRRSGPQLETQQGSNQRVPPLAGCNHIH